MHHKFKNIDSLCVKELKSDLIKNPHQLPIYATSSFEFDDVQQSIDIFTGKNAGYVYSRYNNPTVEAVSRKIAELEGFGTGLSVYGYMTSSGMSAISSLVLSVVKTGDEILTQSDLYGGTTELFSKVIAQSGIKTHFADLTNSDAIEALLVAKRSIKLIYFETPANPTLKCIDIKMIAKIAKKYGILTCVDNTFCTPLLQQPLAMGIDFVIHSTTKYLNGHGNSIAGIVIGHLEEYQHKIWTTIKLLGTNCNPFDAWLLHMGMKTLALRMEKHSENAMAVATYLSGHPKVVKVNYNGLTTNAYHAIAKGQMHGFGGMLSFDVGGTASNAIEVINKLSFCTIAPTLGDVDTLVLHPASSSHLNIDKKIRESNGITDSLIRLSIGIENSEDIIADLEQALG